MQHIILTQYSYNEQVQHSPLQKQALLKALELNGFFFHANICYIKPLLIT